MPKRLRKVLGVFRSLKWKELIIAMLENRFQLVVFLLQLFLFAITLWTLYEMLGLLRILLR